MDLSEVRKRAWKTRRKMYGPRGHAGSYTRPCNCSARHWIVRLHREGVLSEGQASKALGIDRVLLRTLADEQTPETMSDTGETPNASQRASLRG